MVKITGIPQEHLEDVVTKNKYYIEDIEDEIIAAKTAVILSNTVNNLDLNVNAPDIWKQNSYKNKMLELTKEVFHPVHFLGWHLVNIHPLISPNNIINFKKFKDSEVIIDSESVVSKSRMLRTCYNDDFEINSVALELRNEIIREILTDLRNNAGTVASVKLKNYADIYCRIVEIFGILYRKTLCAGAEKWVVTSPEIGEIIKPYIFEQKEKTSLSPYYAGIWSGKLYIDPLFPTTQMLIGLKDKNSIPFNGYFYCPYMAPFGRLPPTDPDACWNARFMTRYAKYLPKDGAKFYARINFNLQENNE